jgi:hypothetical protein
MPQSIFWGGIFLTPSKQAQVPWISWEEALASSDLHIRSLQSQLTMLLLDVCWYGVFMDRPKAMTLDIGEWDLRNNHSTSERRWNKGHLEVSSIASCQIALWLWDHGGPRKWKSAILKHKIRKSLNVWMQCQVPERMSLCLQAIYAKAKLIYQHLLKTARESLKSLSNKKRVNGNWLFISIIINSRSIKCFC